MSFPAFESMTNDIEHARQMLQGAGMIRDRATVLGVAIDGGTATGADLIRWARDLRNILYPVQIIVAISGMQATVRSVIGDGSLDLTAERTAMIAAITAARTAAQALVPSIAPTWDSGTDTIDDAAALTPGANLTAFRAALTALVATIAPGA